MSVITRVPEPNIWDVICQDFSAHRPPYDEDDDNASVQTDYRDYDPAIHNPVFYGKMNSRVDTDVDPFHEVDVAKSHPSCAGYAFTEKPPKSPPQSPPPAPNKDSCTAKEYLEYYVLPILLPALEEMLKQAKLEKCFERKRTKFNALDFITEYLYRVNPRHQGREETDLWSIPFVMEWLKDHPRPPLPLSLIWTEDEAALIIQSHWRGYLVRRVPNIQELRQWQREWREENRGIQSRVSDFWNEKMPDWDKATPNASEEQLNREDIPVSVQSPDTLTPAAAPPTTETDAPPTDTATPPS